MGWLQRRRVSDAAIARSNKLLAAAEGDDVTEDRRRALIELSDAWLRHAAAACPAPR